MTVPKDLAAKKLEGTLTQLQTYGWCQEQSSKETGEMCLTRALYEACYNTMPQDAACGSVFEYCLELLGQAVHPPGTCIEYHKRTRMVQVQCWNDVQDRCVAEVYALLQRIIDELRDTVPDNADN